MENSLASVTFWGLFFGTVFGIIAGTLVQYITQFLVTKAQARVLLKGFRRELEYDTGVITELLREAARLRTAIGSNGLTTYTGYFKFTDVFFVLSNRALSEGLLYHAIEQQNLLALQKAATFFIGASESWVSVEIAKLKQGQGMPANFVNYLEEMMTQHHAALQEIIRKLDATKRRGKS